MLDVDLLKKLARWFASIPISIVALHSIMLGTLTSAGEYDGWISWGHEASVLMVVPIVASAACTYAARH